MFELVNIISVSLFGICIAYFMLDFQIDRKTTTLFFLFSTFISILLILTTSLFENSTTEQIYPLLVHLPFLLFVRLQFKLPINEIILSLCTAYVFTTPRKWFGDLVGYLLGGHYEATIISQIIISVPLLLLFYKFVRKPFIKITHVSKHGTNILLALVGTYYIVAYSTTVYSNLLYKGRVLAVGFLATCVTLLLFLLLIYYFREITNRISHEEKELLFTMHIDATKEYIESLKDSQLKTSIIRHDMRHHLHHINDYIENGNIAGAQDYIKQTNHEIESTEVQKYCANDTVNLVLTSFVIKAKKFDIDVTIEAIIPSSIEITTTDLCVVLANGMENAINACQKISDPKKRKIKFFCHLKNSKLFIQIINPYVGDLKFKNDLPVTDQKGHGMGALSISIIAQKYQGLYSFKAENGMFTLNLIL